MTDLFAWNEDAAGEDDVFFASTSRYANRVLGVLVHRSSNQCETGTERKGSELGSKRPSRSLDFWSLSPSTWNLFSDLLLMPYASYSRSIDDGGFHLTIQTDPIDDLAVRGPREERQISPLLPI